MRKYLTSTKEITESWSKQMQLEVILKEQSKVEVMGKRIDK